MQLSEAVSDVEDHDGSGHAGADFQELTSFVNVDRQGHSFAIPALTAGGVVAPQ